MSELSLFSHTSLTQWQHQHASVVHRCFSIVSGELDHTHTPLKALVGDPVLPFHAKITNSDHFRRIRRDPMIPVPKIRFFHEIDRKSQFSPNSHIFSKNFDGSLRIREGYGRVEKGGGYTGEHHGTGD